MCIVRQDGNTLKGINLEEHGFQGFPKVCHLRFCANAIGQKVGCNAVKLMPKIGVDLLSKG